ncbi:DUF6617 family protein [Terrimonas alba]|uniref:DUF6617 family protein n=1 Tax=Terrimonas alba TaxID=3349636 RepID=UPI0035F26031
MKLDSSEFEVLFTELKKRIFDYYGEGTFIGFTTRMGSYLANFKSEFLKNLSLLTKENKTDYLKYLNSELDKIADILMTGDERYKMFLNNFGITESDLLTHKKPENELYTILSNELYTLKISYKKEIPGRITYDEIVDLLRVFYRQFSHLYFKDVYYVINGNKNKDSNEAKIISEQPKITLTSFGFTNDKIEILRKIYHSLILDTGKFIDHEETPEKVFVEILTTKNYNSIPGKIRFECETTQVAYILSLMKKFSAKFTFSNIEASKKFHSQAGTLITASSLSKAKSLTPQPKQYKHIESFFSDLIASR